jgi:hypothetical protein
MEFHLKGLTLQMTMASPDHCLRLRYKITDHVACQGTKYRFYHHHHRPGQNLPEAIAVLDPKRDDCNYPYDECVDAELDLN